MANTNIPEKRTTTIAESGNQGDIRMWPSEDWASRLSDWANIGLIASLIAGVVSTFLLVWMGNVKEAYLKTHLQQSTIDLEKQKGETAKAQAEVLRLQKQRLPRTLEFESNDSLQALIASLKRTPFTAEISYKKGDGEASWFAEQIRGLLLSAGWTVPHPTPIPEDMSAHAVEKLKAQPDGVTVITKRSSDKDKPDAPEAILTNLLSKSLGSVALSPDANLPDNFLRIIILQKP